MRTIITTTGTSLLTNAARELKKPPASVTDEELRFFWQQVGAEAATAETNSLLKIAHPDEEIVLLHTTTPEGERCVKRVYDDGSIHVLWADNEKATNITIRTTARGQAQTLRFCDRYIRPLLNS